MANKFKETTYDCAILHCPKTNVTLYRTIKKTKGQKDVARDRLYCCYRDGCGDLQCHCDCDACDHGCDCGACDKWK